MALTLVVRERHNFSCDTASVRVLHVLVIRSWTSDLREIEEALRRCEVEAQITRVDFEAALDAALVESRFDLAIYDPAVEGLARDRIEARLCWHRLAIPVIDLVDPEPLPRRLLATIRSL